MMLNNVKIKQENFINYFKENKKLYLKYKNKLEDYCNKDKKKVMLCQKNQK